MPSSVTDSPPLDEPAAPPDGKPPLGPRVRAALRAQYLEVDRRLLAAFRVYFGLVLLVDLLRRFPVTTLFYTNDGILPNHYALYAPLSDPSFSLYDAFSTRNEVLVAFTLTALVYLGLVVGYRTRLMQILTLILYPSLISRNLFFEMGGSCSLAITAGWTVFLPLGDRFSVDALRASLARRRETKASALNDRADMGPVRGPHVSIVVLGLLIQVTIIYLMNCLQKTGDEWKTGEAVHYVLWQNRIATPICGFVRMHEPRWFSPMLSWGTLVVEGIAPLMLLGPVFWRWTRSIYVPLAMSLHAGIALFVDVGPYSYIMFALDFLMLPGFWFDWVGERLATRKDPRLVAYDPEDAVMHGIARVLARLDTYERLRFVDRHDPGAADALVRAPDAPLAVRRRTGTWALGGDAVLEALRSTPFGAWVTHTPLRWVVSAAFRWRLFLARAWALVPGVPESRDVPAATLAAVAPGFPRARVAGREALAALFVVATFGQIIRDDWWLADRVPPRFRDGAPGLLGELPVYLRQFQGWMMFRYPPRTDGTVIVDAVTEDGRHIDPFTGKRPDFDVMLHGPLLYGQLFCDYFNHISEGGNDHYRRHLGHYLEHWQELEHRPARDRIQSYKVYWMESDSPPPGRTVPTHLRRSLLLSGPSSS